MAITPSESDIQKQILEYLSLRPGVYWRQNTGAVTATDKAGRKRFIRYGRPGQADITGIRPHPHGIGQRIEIEVKCPGKKQTEAQINFQREIESEGGLYILATDVKDVIGHGL